MKMGVASLRIQEKIEELKEFLTTLTKILPLTYEQYTQDIIRKAACERYFEKIVEALIQLDKLLLQRENIMPVEEYFLSLYEHKLINKELYLSLRAIKGLRNIIIHQYASVDDKIIYDAFTTKLYSDVHTFITVIEEFYT